MPWPGALMMASVPTTMRARSIAEPRPKWSPASSRLSACSGENPTVVADRALQVPVGGAQMDVEPPALRGAVGVDDDLADDPVSERLELAREPAEIALDGGLEAALGGQLLGQGAGRGGQPRRVQQLRVDVEHQRARPRSMACASNVRSR